MIKSELIEKKKVEVSYPCLKKSNCTGNIVLFTAPNTGVMVSKGNNTKIHNVGDYSDIWEESNFEYIPGLTVTLTNE